MQFRFIILLLIIGSQCAKAQAEVEVIPDSIPSQMLEEVVVTATRTQRQLSSLPLPVTLVGKKKILQSGTIRLNEILNEQTGIITVADESGFQGVQIQGIASDYILILMDGVPLVGRSAGNFDLSRLTVGNIKQIEVVKGPSSSLYGSEALGGVINIITEKPKSDLLIGNASYRIGSYSQQDINLDLKQGFNKFRYGFFANRFSSNGYDLNEDVDGQTVNPFTNYTLNGRLYYDFNDKLSLFTSARLYDQNQDAGFTLDNIIYEGDTNEQEWNAHTRLDHKWNPNLTMAYEIYFTNYTAHELLVDPSTTDVLSQSDFDQKLLRPEVRGSYSFAPTNQPNTIGFSNGTLTAGAGFQLDDLNRTYFDEAVSFTSQYLYAQFEFDPIENLNVIAGARFDNHSEYNNQFSPKLAMRYRVSDSFSLKGSVGYGFKAPDFRQLYFDFTNSAVGYTVLGYNVALDKLKELDEQEQILEIVVSEIDLNNPLEAESSVGYNLGFTFKQGKSTTEVNFFRNDFKNLIDTRIIARKTNGQNVFSYINFDEIYTTGFEINSGYQFSNNLNISAGYQLLYAYDKQKKQDIDDGLVFFRNPQSGQTDSVSQSDYFGLVNRSRHNANFKVFYDIPSAKTNLNLRLLYRSKYAQFDTNGNGLIDSYDSSFIDGFATVNASASKTFYQNFTLQVGANNLLDYTDNNIPTTPGIQGYLKINYQF
tara:strand:- start:1526 stop:3643 length:2118 start_codon:yes stop_codon:yes gene_type:complete